MSVMTDTAARQMETVVGDLPALTRALNNASDGAKADLVVRIKLNTTPAEKSALVELAQLLRMAADDGAEDEA